MKIKTELTKICDGVYLCEIDNSYDLAMTFCRVQEFYESPFEQVRSKSFTMMEFQRIYSLKNGGTFTYPEDWSGFNIPSGILDKFYKGAWVQTDWNMYDTTLKKIINHIKEEGPYYLIGAQKNDQHTINHELCHAFYNLDKKYKKSVTKLINSIPRRLLDKIKNILRKTGYCNNVLRDEIQAYLSCDKAFLADEIRSDWEKIEKWGIIFENHFNKHIALNIKK